MNYCFAISFSFFYCLFILNLFFVIILLFYPYIYIYIYINFYKPVEFGQIFNFRFKNAPKFNTHICIMFPPQMKDNFLRAYVYAFRK